MVSFRGIWRRAARETLFRLAPDMKRQVRLGRYAETWLRPAGLEERDLSTYVPAGETGHAGIDLRVDEQRARLASWRAYRDLLRCLRDDARINTLGPLGRDGDYIQNNFYPTPDAEVYASMILDFEPTSIIEVGGGFSTLIARATLDEAGRASRLTVIDPEPRTDVAAVADAVVLRPIEETAVDELPVGARTLLFIDSSHVTRAGGDIPHLFNRIVPGLASGTLVHVHDIFLPYDYPYRYQSRFFTEQYVLQALLSHSSRYEVAFATHFMARHHAETMRDVLGSSVIGAHDAHFGGSFWFRIA